MSILRVMNQSKGALAANQLGLSTTSHNISNANTEGYSRQRVDLKANIPVGKEGHRVGTGVGVGSISRTTSSFVNKRIESENSDLGNVTTLQGVYSQIEADLSNESESGISARLSRFFNDLSALSGEPASTPLRTSVRESAEAVASRFREMRGNLTSLKEDLDSRLTAGVEQINGLTSRIAELNQQIVDVEVQGGQHANDERDARDLAVRQLAKLVPVSVTDHENGAVTISSARAGVLVDPTGQYELMTARVPDPVHNSAVHIFTREFGGRQGKDVTKLFGSGDVGAMVSARETVIPKVMERVDNMAFGFASSFNSVHSQGYGTNGKSGVDFFDLGAGGAQGAAERIAISGEIRENVGSMAASDVPGASGDNRRLLALASLQDQAMFDQGRSTLTDYVAATVGSVGVEARAIKDSADTQNSIMEQLNTLREQSSGVSMDEEAVDMLKFQKAFDANAKMIQVADSMLETVINLKRF